MARTSLMRIAGALTLLMLGTSLSATAQRAAELGPNYLRHSAISPDGNSILFSFHGDIYKVPANGGTAVPLTVNAAWEGHPVWSHDGKKIAFASDRNGNLDIYVMPAAGGDATRLTFHSANDIPSDFSASGDKVVFSSGRTKSAATAQFPTTRLPELYQVNVTGGTPAQLSTTGAMDAVWDNDGTQLLYREEKAYESANRKHDQSAFARDIWLYDAKDNKHTQMTADPAGDHTPVWDKDGGFYFLSDRSGTFNVWHHDTNGDDKRLTNHGPHAVRSLTASRDKRPTLAYLYLGDLYTMKGDSRPKRVDIDFATDSHGRKQEPLPVADNIGEFAVSPNGKEIAFVARGDVFVTATDYGTTRRITNTPEAERNVSFTPDGDGLLYAGERDGEWRIYETKRADKSEKYFFTATKLDEKLLFDSDEDVFQPQASPDGKKIAFIAGRDALKVYDRGSGKTVTALADGYNYSYVDGDITYDWSPDSEWLTIDFAPNGRLFFTNIAVVAADGSGEARDISLSGYTDTAPSWHPSGGIVTWATARFGQRDHGSHGTQFDIYAAFLNKEAWEEFNLSKEEFALKKEADEEAKKAEEKDKKDEEKKDEDAEKTVEPIKFDWKRIEDRQKRLTIHSSNLAGAALSKDADKLYYLSSFEGGYDLWVHDFREDETKKLVPLGADRASMQLSDDGKFLFLLADGSLRKIDLEKGAPEGVKVSAMLTVNQAEERDYMFRHIWRQVDDKFYKPDFHGVDWDAMRLDYARKVASTNNNRDFADLMDEMLGELNASHTGGRYFANLGGDSTASLGLLFDPTYKGTGLRVAEVLEKGPVADADKPVTAGMVLKAINGTAIDADSNYAALLNGKMGERTRLTFAPEKGNAFDIVVKPASLGDESDWMYDRWVDSRRALVDKLSAGRLAYVHVPNMSDRTYRGVYREMFGRGMSKEAIVVDTRFNRGGDLTDDLVQLLGGKQYMTNMPNGREAQGEPLTRWTKPSIVLMNEGNYSDGHCFPAGYSALEMGKTVGMPVPGTCTYVWWERLMSGDLVFGIPQLGIKDRSGDWMENKQLEPTIEVKNDPDSLDEGRDPQLEKAVEVMLADLDAKQQ
ncbi:S41 family peptidase [Kordiimonas aestuarii]|uniref:S41 family peptidase n=1 Tax=Kordiimonas aestuarii TaxID=1005925 RepID=UPI0021D37752|nr:S41 family peptidase [Kordiimonas aestuarii]